MQIEFGKIVTNALSTLVAAVFVGAAAIVWQAATSVDDRIKEANHDIVQQQTALKATQETIVPELTSMKRAIEDLQAEIRSLSKLLAEAKALPDNTTYKPGEPLILKEFAKDRNASWSKQETDRINNQIDTRQQEIYKQRLPK
jgi:uncharacterized protein YlxW (UPF0749 family)